MFYTEINKLDYQERLEKLDLPTLAYRQFCSSIIETYKILPTVPTHSLNVKSQIHMDMSLQLKQNYQEPGSGKFFKIYK